VTPDESRQVIALLSQQTYVRETEGENNSPEIREYLNACGLTEPAPWCAAFVCWGMHYVLGDRFTLPCTASCEMLREAAKKRGMLIGTPRYGCIGLLIDTAKDHAHHAFLVTSDPNADGSVDTCEGNTNIDGSREGIGVFLRQRCGPTDHLTYEFIAPEGM
jgi:hypothetical protein